MTNQEKFIEVMNKYFDAGLTKENFQTFAIYPFEMYQFPGKQVTYCSPCGVFRQGACESFTCEGCADWWEEEWKLKGEMNHE